VERPSGGVFHTGCGQIVGDVCERVEPGERDIDATHKTACHIYAENGA